MVWLSRASSMSFSLRRRALASLLVKGPQIQAQQNVAAVVTATATTSTTAISNLNHFKRYRSTSANHSSNDQQQGGETPEATFSIYEYPTRTEAPIITSTKAKDIHPEQIYKATVSQSKRNKQQPEQNQHSEQNQPQFQPRPRRRSSFNKTDDPFDESGTFSMDEQQRIKESQKQIMQNLSLNSLPITKTVPEFVPPNVKSDELTVPETIITTLNNGIRVVSQETYGQMCTIGVLTNVGSRHEIHPTSSSHHNNNNLSFTTSENQQGMVHLLETMAFGSTNIWSGLEISELLQDWGATRFVSHSREQTLHCIDILRPNVDKGMQLLQQVVLEPKIINNEQEFYQAKAILEFQAQEQLPELVLGEAVQVAAYGQNQQLGQLHFATAESIETLTPVGAQQFLEQNIINNPKGMVIAGAGIAHDKLVTLAETYFGHLSQQSAPMTIPSIYRGGSHFIPNDPNMMNSVYSPADPNYLYDLQYCRVALAFPVGGWHDDSMVTACVLQTLLGGGSSFSAGGPGKGMYSRMYQQVLNRYGWMETAEAFTTFAEEGGLFGVSASTSAPQKVGELVTILADQLARLAIQPVSEIELSRARNMLKCNVLAQLESRLILFEDMGRQVLTYGKRESATQTCAKIDAVTAEDIQRMVTDMLTAQSSPPTLAATGSHLEHIPTHEQVQRWFQ